MVWRGYDSYRMSHREPRNTRTKKRADVCGMQCTSAKHTYTHVRAAHAVWQMRQSGCKAFCPTCSSCCAHMRHTLCLPSHTAHAAFSAEGSQICDLRVQPSRSEGGCDLRIMPNHRHPLSEHTLCSVHAFSHRPCLHTPCMPFHTVYAFTHRACLFTPSMPSHTMHAFIHRPCLHTPSMPSYTVHAFTHRPCLFTPSIPFHTTYAFPYVSLFTLCMPSQTVHALRFSSSSSSGSSSPDYQNLIRAFTHTPSKSGSSPTV